MAICLLRAGPQDLPASRFLLAWVLGLHALLGLVFGLFEGPAMRALAGALLGTVLLYVLAQVLLILRGRMVRLVQTVTALAGSEFLLGLIALLPALWFYAVEGAGQRLLPSLLTLAILVWNLVVTGHILRHALEIHQSFALLLALGYIILAYQLMALLSF